MLFDLILKFVVTPENILELSWSILTTACICLIFNVWNEKWWKILVPFYGNYLIYKHTWKNLKWLFLIELIFNVIAAKCNSFTKKHIINNVFYTIKTYIQTEQLDISISSEQLFLYIILFSVSTAIVFILKRITYVKICGSLNIDNILLKIGTFIFPELFLLLDYICYKKIYT